MFIWDKIKEVRETRYQGGFWKFHLTTVSLKIERWLGGIIKKREEQGKGKITIRYIIWASFFMLGFMLG